MGKITALKQQKRNTQRINVYLDGEFAFGLSRFAAAWLEVGQDLPAEKIRRLQEADEQETAYQRALNYLSYRPRSEQEVRRNLQKHATSETVIDKTLERLRRNGFVDDLQFAKDWAENRSTFRPRGRRALAAELRQKGIAREIIEAALQNLDEDALAHQAAVKQFRKYANLEWADFRRKMTAFLARRGFDYETAKSAVEDVWEMRNQQP